VIAKIVIVLVLVVAGLVVAQREHAFQKWGVVGSCDAVRAPAGDTGAWYACREGLLTGFPTLLGDQCTRETRSRGYEYWRCPVRLDRFAAGR
jgi:hypothetical protein